jgi:hypothetical protein
MKEALLMPSAQNRLNEFYARRIAKDLGSAIPSPSEGGDVVVETETAYKAMAGYSYGKKNSMPNESKIFTELAGQGFRAE